jgi:hypothetical protein
MAVGRFGTAVPRRIEAHLAPLPATVDACEVASELWMTTFR